MPRAEHGAVPAELERTEKGRTVSMEIKKFVVVVAVPDGVAAPKADEIADSMYTQENDGRAWEVREVEISPDDVKINRK